MISGRHHGNVEADLAVLHAIRDMNGIQRPMTFSEIAEPIGVSKTLIQEIEAKALRKLRHPTRARMLQEAMQ